MMRRLSRLFAGVLTLAGLSLGVARAEPTERRDIFYGQDPNQQLDLYLPGTATPAKLVVFIHGGWRNHRGGARFIAGPLNAAGYAVADVDFRPLPPLPLEGAVQDVAAATAYLLTHARSLGLDPARFALAGHSAGGGIAALLATDPSYLKRAGVDPAHLAGVLLLDGVYDARVAAQDHPSKIATLVFGTDPGRWRTLSATVQVATLATHPRFCVAGEDTDRRMMPQAQLFEQALTASHQTMETVTASGFRHAEMLRRFADQGSPLAPFATACLNRAFAAK